MTIHPTTTELTEPQVIVMDTLRSVACDLIFMALEPTHAVRISVTKTLETQGLSWEQFLEFARK